MTALRRIVPLLFVPLCLLASALATGPWLRSFPMSVAGVPLYGAAVLSVLVPLVTVHVRPTWLWLGVLIDAVVFLAYTFAVVLQDLNVADLVEGLYRGPSEVLTFALPLVSPRSLLVAPVALTWLAGALAGQCVARRWYTLLPYVGFIVAFGLAYAGTQRAAGSDLASARHLETLLAAGLLATLLVMRVAQTWVRQDETAETTQPDGILPLRGLVVGTATTLAVALIASLVVQLHAFPKRSSAPQRVPSVNDSEPLTPMSFVAGLRPRNRAEAVQPLFTVRVDRSISGYFAIANVDEYDGSGWSFDRTFRPSGGVLPVDTDLDLRTSKVVTQQYRIASGQLTSAPWMPFLYRAQKVTGTSVNIDASSGMIVPAGRLGSSAAYTVVSGVAAAPFDQIRAATATPDTATPTTDIRIPGALRGTLGRLINAFSAETGTPSTPALPFLQALQKDLRTNYALSGAAQGSSSGSAAVSTAPTSPSKVASTPAKPTSSTGASNTPPAADLAGGTGFAEVLASILGPARNGTPEQYATLVTLIARQLGIPARVVTGFRVTPKSGVPAHLAAGQYDVTTAHAWTWVELPLIGSGWVVLDPSPGRFAQENQPTQSGSAAPTSSSALPPSQNALVTQGDNGHAVAPKSDVPAAAEAPKPALLIALSVVLGLLLLALLVFLLSRKSVRAHRRRSMPDPRSRLIGAWQESLDVLTEAGLPELTTLTSAEIAQLTGEQFGADSGAQAASLGAAANAVAYSAATVVAPDAADAAWSQHRLLRSTVRNQLGVRDRMTASLRYHRPKNAAGPTSPASWAIGAAAAREHAREEARRTAPGARRNYRGRRRAH